MHIAQTALSAVQHGDFGVVAGEVCDDLAGFIVTDDGTLRHADHQILAVLSVHALSAALFAGRCHITGFVTEVLQSVEALIDFEDNVSASAAVAAVGTAGRHIELSAEGNVSVAALAALDENFCYICKHIVSFRLVFVSIMSIKVWQSNGRPAPMITKAPHRESGMGLSEFKLLCNSGKN